MIPPDMDINKGVELILKGEKRPKPKQTPKFFDIKLSLFGREFRLSLDIKKKTNNSKFKGQTSKYHSPTKKLHFLIYSHSMVAGGLLDMS